MNIDEWEILSRDGFLDYHEDGGKNNFALSNRSSNPKSMFNMNYFVCPSSPPRNSRAIQPNQVVPVPFQLEPISVTTGKDQDVSKDAIKMPIDIKVVPSVIMPEIKGPDSVSKEADQDPISQVFFKKMKENEFVDMKMDSPKSPTKGFAPPQIDAGKFDFEDKGEILDTKINSPGIKNEKENTVLEDEVNWEENSGGLNLWKWSLNGIGAICSFGVAAATVCIIIFGSHQRNKQQQQNQKLRFQIYTDDKRIKQVVHHATKLNEAITAVRGVPIARAHITYGGYFEGL